MTEHKHTEMSGDDVKKLISTSILRIRMRSPFFATLMLYARFLPDPHCLTCYTDGKDIYFNPDFIQKLPLKQRDGAFLHEVLHAALSHVFRVGTRDKQIWNLSSDICVNGIVRKQDYCELIAGAISDAKMEDMQVEEIYELLMKQYEKERQNAQAGKNGPSAVNGQKSIGKGSSGKGQSPGKGLGEADGGDSGSVGGKAKQFAQNPCFGHSKDKEEDGETMQDVLRRMAEAEAYWKQALRQAEIIQRSTNQGKMPAGWDRIARLIEQPQLDWRSQLWRFLVKTPTDFAGFDRRLISRGYYLEQLEGESVQVYVCIDTSGSIDDKQLALFMGELYGILGSYPHLKAYLFYADCALHGPYEIDKAKDVPPPKGGGGTSFVPFFAKIKEMHQAMEVGVAVYLTDGYGAFPEEKDVEVSTLWVVTPGSLDSEKFPFGTVARLLQDG